MYMLLRNEVRSGNQEELPTEGCSNLEAEGQAATWLGDKEWGGTRGMCASASSIVRPLAGFKQERAENRFKNTTLVIVWEKALKIKIEERKD